METIDCPNCDESIEIESFGTVVECPNCKATIYIDWECNMDDEGGESYYFWVERWEKSDDE